MSNQPKTFTSCDQSFDAEDSICDMNKHFECNNVRPEDFVKFATFQLKEQASIWWQQLKDATSQTTAPEIGTLTETWLALVFPLKRKG